MPLLRTAGSVLWLICRVVTGAEDESEAGDEPNGGQPSILLAQSGLAPSLHCHQEFNGRVRLIAGLIPCRLISRRGESVAVGSLGDVAGSGKGCEAVIERGGPGAAVCPQFRE